jgi:hypothetical protein
VGKGDEDLNGSNVVVSIMCTQQTGATWALANIYNNTVHSANNNLTALMMGVTNTNCWSYQFNDEGDSVLNGNEKAYFVIDLGPSYVLPAYSKLKLEIRTGRGAALSVLRDIPGGLPNNGVVDLN